ncbi:hemerythrin domain-containing protein [Thermoplasma sp.]|uniref:hemerythrin domain-containing protein n=1 Tax=Thermoplasma sp. TaxID=1973142 RepID=UPI00261409DE|nr:hemerythrin domain-containing protein [Thermoplasma sp.]
MADLSELLMVEHSAIRLLAKVSYGKESLDIFEDFNDYLVKDHVEVEERILFPAITDFEWEDRKEFEKTVNRIKADHKLIETLADNLIKWKRSGDEDLFKLRLPLFYKTLTEHNLSEEDQIFPRWKRIDDEVRDITLREALDLIEETGIERYSRNTGISKEFIAYIQPKNSAGTH